MVLFSISRGPGMGSGTGCAMGAATAVLARVATRAKRRVLIFMMGFVDSQLTLTVDYLEV